MEYRFLADSVLLLHLGFIMFVMFGALLVARRPRLLPLHLLAVAWGFAIEATGGACPLTQVENTLRHAAGDDGFSGGFIEHYLVPLIYPPGVGRGTQFALAAAVLVLNAGLYAWIWRRRRDRS